MNVRQPVVAGQFYPASRQACRSELESYLGSVQTGSSARLVGGIVPHAGWMCSGSVAAEVIKAVVAEAPMGTCVIFGAAHRPTGPFGSVYGSGAWETPIGAIEIDEQLARAAVAPSQILIEDPRAHTAEHSIEVQVPFVQHVAPNMRLLPVIVPPTASAHEVGRIVAEAAARLGREVVYLGSTDLTHYGPRYRFMPKGEGEQGLTWAKDVNDRRFIELVLQMKADTVVGEAMTHRNACGAGAVAATVSACRTAGATRARLLRHTTSNEVLRSRFGDMEDAVGYAGIVFERSERTETR